MQLQLQWLYVFMAALVCVSTCYVVAQRRFVFLPVMLLRSSRIICWKVLCFFCDLIISVFRELIKTDDARLL